MTSTDTLLPCPFCGTDELSHGWAAPGFRGGVSDGHVECMECGALVIAATEQDATAAWNRRTTPTPATEEREAVARALCKSEGTGQCAAMCLSHFARDTKKGKCAESVAVWGRKADAALSALREITKEPEA